VSEKLKLALINEAIILVLLAFSSWWVMLLIGVAHHEDPRVPGFGFVTVFVLLVAVRVVGSVLRSEALLHERAQR
jgi:hypothetical protein